MKTTIKDSYKFLSRVSKEVYATPKLGISCFFPNPISSTLDFLSPFLKHWRVSGACHFPPELQKT